MESNIQLPYQQNGYLVIGTSPNIKGWPQGNALVDKDNLTLSITALLGKKTVVIPISTIQLIKRTKSFNFGDCIQIAAQNQPSIFFRAINLDVLTSVISSVGVKVYNSDEEVPEDQRKLVKSFTGSKIILLIVLALFIVPPLFLILMNLISRLFR